VTSFDFYLRPYLYLLPNRVPFEDHFTTAPFLVGLFAPGAGTDESPLRQGGLFQVLGCSIEDGPDTALLRMEREQEVALWLRAISTGSELTFSSMTKKQIPLLSSGYNCKTTMILSDCTITYETPSPSGDRTAAGRPQELTFNREPSKFAMCTGG
jgi:hypothetical protein